MAGGAVEVRNGALAVGQDEVGLALGALGEGGAGSAVRVAGLAF